MSEQRKDTQRFWWRLHKAIALAPEISGLLLVRYLQQGTPWTEEQKQALRQVVLKQSSALTWQQFAAVDLIELRGELTDTLVLLESFAIYIDHRLRSFVADASRTYRERVAGGQAAQTGATASPMYREGVVGGQAAQAGMGATASSMYRGMVVEDGDVGDLTQEQISQWIEMAAVDWQNPFRKETYPDLRLKMKIDSDSLHKKIIETMNTHPSFWMDQGFRRYVVSVQSVDLLEWLLVHAIHTPEEEAHNALLGWLSEQRYPIDAHLKRICSFLQIGLARLGFMDGVPPHTPLLGEALLTPCWLKGPNIFKQMTPTLESAHTRSSFFNYISSIQSASEKMKKGMASLLAESAAPEVLHFFWDDVIEKLSACEGGGAFFLAEKKLEEVLEFSLLPEHYARLREMFFRLPAVLQVRLLPKLGEDASAETGEILLWFFFGQSTDLRYAASQGLLRYLGYHPRWLGRLIEFDGELLQVERDPACEPWGLAQEDLLERFAQTKGDWRGLFEVWEGQRAAERRPSLFGYFRSGRALIARWIGDSREGAYLPLLQGWFRLPSLDLWERSEIALALARFGDASPASFLREQLWLVRDIHLFSDIQQNLLIAASLLLDRSVQTVAHLLQQESGLFSTYMEIVKAPAKGAEQTVLLMWLLLQLRSNFLYTEDLLFDDCLARLFLLLEFFSRPSLRIDREIWEAFLSVVEEICYDKKEEWDALGGEIGSCVVAYALSRLGFLPRKPWMDGYVEQAIRLFGTLSSEGGGAFWKQQRESFEASLFS